MEDIAETNPPRTVEETLARINAFLDKIEPLIEQFPDMARAMESSPLGKMLGGMLFR